MLEKQLTERDGLIVEQQNGIIAQAQENQALKCKIHNLQKEAFGSKSEKTNKLNQALPDNKTNPNSSIKKRRKPPNRTNSRKIPSEISIKKVELSLSADEAICPC